MRRSLNRSIAAWLAIIAVTLNAFWPLLAHARPADAGKFVEVCTMEGMKRVSAPDSDAGGPESGEHKAAHCPFCMSPGVPALPPAPIGAVLEVSLLQVGSLHVGPTLFQSFHAREHASPRAPPFSIVR